MNKLRQWLFSQSAVSLFAGIGLIALGVALYGMWKDRPEPPPIAGPVQINDSTVLLAAELSSARRELKALKEAAKAVDAKVVAGVRIKIQAETIYVDRTVRVTDTLVDGTRLASVVDTTAEGVQVSIDAVAPPSPSPLEIGYRVVLPSFAPEVGFVKKDDHYYAVVTVPGRQFTTEQAFFTAPRARRFELVGGAQLATEQERLRALAFLGAAIRVNDRSRLTGAITTGNNLLMQYQYRIF